MKPNNEMLRLRAMLDDRGIEHVDADDGHTQHTWWSDGDHEIGACDSGKRLSVYNLTPEQAIAATVTTEPDEANKSECYLMYNGKKYPAVLDFGFLGLMPITIDVGGFRYLVEVPNEE